MNKQAHGEHYQRVRQEFDDLSLQDRAVFLAEATVSTIIRGAEQISTAVAEELDKLFRTRSGAGKGEPAAEPQAPSGTGNAAAPGEGHHVET